MRYFAATDDVYDTVCQQLDAAYGYPNVATKTERTLPVASLLPRDGRGRLCIGLPDEYCEFDLPSQMLPALLNAGLVTEISEAEYMAAVQFPPG